MKKFISMVMAAAMVVSLVPATAFAATGEVVAKSAKVVGKVEEGKNFEFVSGKDGLIDRDNAAEVQIKVDSVTVKQTAGGVEQEVVIKLDGATFATNSGADATNTSIINAFALNGVKFNGDGTTEVAHSVRTGLSVEIKDMNADVDKLTVLLKGDLKDDDMITFDLASQMKYFDSVGDKAYVTVDTDIEGGDIAKTVYAEIIGETLDVDVDDTVEIPAEDDLKLEDIVIKSKVSAFDGTEKIKVKVNGGFEFVYGYASAFAVTNGTFEAADLDDNVFIIKPNADATELTIKQLGLYDESAGAGKEATITVSCNGFEGDSVVVATVVAEGVTMSVDTEEDVPVMYSGVNAADKYLTSGTNNHKSLKVNLKESLIGSWSNNKGFTMTLPEGVYATNVTVTGDGSGNLSDADFKAAYEKGDYETFKFVRGCFTETDLTGTAFDLDVQMTLIAEPGFVGDVTLTLEGAALDTQEVVIAKFEAPFVVEAAQNDVIIDYRNTEIPTAIVVKEAEAGLWSAATGDKLDFTFFVEKFDSTDFEDDAVYTVNAESEMEITEHKTGLGFTVKDESIEEAAVVTIDGISLYMSRDLAAGAYDLKASVNACEEFYKTALFTDEDSAVTGYKYTVADVVDYVNGTDFALKPATVKEGFINIITAGRDKDDASFTKKVIVPVGENYMIAGEETIALEVPAYINANNYTMLPVRAVATALGINNNNVLWSQAAKQVTILYGQRIITMTVGEAVVYVNGSAIPAVAAVEVVNGRAFLGFRDLANALGVTTIDYVDGKAIMN